MIYDYHTGDRGWLNENVNWSSDELIGMEIEVQVRRDFDPYKVAEEACSFGKILAERDCSLDYEKGIEFIFRCVPLSEITWDSFIGKWSQFMRTRCLSWSRRGHGMHISVNSGAMSKLHVGKFCHFINNNKKFCVKLAGRDLGNYNEDYQRIWEQERPAYRRSQPYHLEFKNLDYPARSFAAGQYNNGRTEIRIFQSTTNFSKIRKNCEFIDALRCWTKEESVENLTPKRFKEYVNDTHYNELRDFINRKSVKEVLV